jgi:hypothetical protein
VIIGPPQYGYAWFAADSPAAALQGFHINALNKPLYFGRDQVGDLVRRPWNAIGDTINYGPGREGITQDVIATATGAGGASSTATIAAVAGSQFWITDIFGGYSAAGFGTAQLTFAVAGQEIVPFQNAFQFHFERAIPAGVGNLASLTVSAVAVVTATASLRGFQVGPQQITIVEIYDMCECPEALARGIQIASTHR